jgi:CheY-like chemotaxis protein
MAGGTGPGTVRGFIPPGVLQGPQVQRIVLQAMDRLMPVDDRDAILTMALVSTNATALPETATEVTAFVFGPLRAAVDQARGGAVAEQLLVSLTPFLTQACRNEGVDLTPVAAEQSDPQPAGLPERPPISASAGSLLVVEPDARTRAQIVQRLRAESYEVLAAPDGHVALAMAMRSRPDLLVVATTMPVVGGRQLMALLKVAFAADAPPVVLLTDANSGADAATIYGAATVVPAPLDLDQLLNEVGAIIAAHRK